MYDPWIQHVKGQGTTWVLCILKFYFIIIIIIKRKTMIGLKLKKIIREADYDK